MSRSINVIVLTYASLDMNRQIESLGSRTDGLETSIER